MRCLETTSVRNALPYVLTMCYRVDSFFLFWAFVVRFARCHHSGNRRFGPSASINYMRLAGLAVQ